MKTKFKRMSKRTLAVFLGVLMLVTSIAITANAYYWDNGNWYLKSDIDSWGTGLKMANNSSNDDQAYKDIYLFGSSSNSNFNFKFKEEDGSGNNSWFGPNSGSDTACGTSGTQGGEGKNGNYYINRKSLGTTATTVYKVRIWFEHANWVGAWYEKSATYTSLAPTLTAPSTGTVGTAITLSGSYTSANKVGTVTGKYQYSTDNGSTWTDLASGSYTASAAGTVKFRYKVTDGGVVAGTNSTANRVEYSEEKSCTFAAAATTYTSIAVAAKGSTDGSTFNTTLSGTPATISANSYTTGSSALTITADTVSGYTFAQWKVTKGSGTIGSSTTANTTFTPTASNTTVTAQYKKNYTFSNGTTDTHGTVTVPSGTVLAGADYSGTVTPADGYKIKSLTVGDVAVSDAAGKTSAYTYSGTTGSSSTGTTTPISVVATFEANTAMNLYIAGRFHVKNSSGNWVNTFGSGGNWNATSNKIPFTYLSGTTYKVDTNATLAELSEKLSNYDPVFFVYDTTNSKNWYASSATTMSTSGTTLVSSGGANNNLKFSSTSTDGPVTVYYDSNTHKIWYSIPDLYDVTVADADGGSVTASPSRTQENATVTLTITPSSGYQLSSITAKQGSTNVTLSGTGNTRTFTMPAGDVTVNPVFSKIDYTLTKNSTSNGSFKLTNASGTEITKAQIGDTVKVVPTANTGYTVNTVKHGTTSTPNTSITASGSTYSFTMGAANEYVAVTFKEVTGTAVAKAYTSGSASSTGGTVKVGSGTAGASANATVGIATSATVVAAEKKNYSFTGWEKSGTNASHIKLYTDSACTTEYTSGATKTIYVKTDGTSGITTSNAEVRALFVPTDYTGLTVGAQYTENNSTYTDFETTPSGITIAANHGTNQTGVAVSAPATDPTGYVFAGWYTANGSFANPANKDTTFKPNAANAKAYARYKKIHNITISVDNTGTGAGTATVSKTSVEAGGSYTITATAASHSAVESVKVNGTAVTATASQTITPVTADQTVVVKFKSNVYLKGTMNATAWAGDVMQANTAGTSYTKSEVVLNAGTTYEFKHWVDSGGNGTYSITVGTWTLNNIATHSTKSDGYGGTNLTITPSVKAKVTFVSDGTKFTSITAIPYDSTTYNVTLTQSADYTITSTYMGVEYTTSGKNANVTVPVYSGTGFSYTVTPASGKYLSGVAQSESVALSPAFSTTTHANSYTGTVSSVSKAFAVSATAASKLTVTAKTNKSARGTVSVNNATAYPGQTVTITVTPKNGILSSLVVTNNSTSAVVKKWQRNSSGEIKVQASTKKTKNSLLTAADDPLTFTMPNASVTVNATFDAYSAESTWYYNGYDTSGNALSGYHTKQMTEGMVGGNKFSYYHVEGRTGTDQLMTVSDGVPSSGTRYVYFVRPNNYGDGWSASNNPKAHFWKNGGQDYDTWPGTEMSWQWNNDYGQGVYKIAIPDGADRVSFNDATNNGQHQTLDIDLTTTSGAYYVGEWNSTYSKYDYGTWDTGWADQGWVASGTEYFYQNSTHNGDYTGDFNTKGFYNHNTANKLFAKPKDLGSYTGDYYINVLYPNTSYTINGVTKSTGTNPMIIWSAEPLAGDDETIKIYAKDGAIRAETFGSTYANIADTKIYLNNTVVGSDHSGNITNQTYQTYKATKGETIVIKTQIGATDSSNLSNAAALKAKYYVRGFCVNGEVSELLEWNDNGLYTLTYKVPEDYEGKAIEITPIYYLKDTSANPIVTYRVTGFTDELKAVGSGKPGWGDTLYTYPYYGKLGGQNNAFGAYPGQPMVYYKGQYQMQIPQKSTAWDPYQETAATVNNTTVAGITMSNGYWDSVHKQIMGYGDNSTSADHVQTYDYGDFYKIFNEKKPVDNIVFDFKYRTKKHNFENQPGTTITKANLDNNYGTNGNGFELLTNFHGRNVDLFGTPLSGDAADPSKTTPVYVVSIGGVNGSAGVENIAGYYATEWMVYGSSNGTNYSRIFAGGKNSIPPEVLVLNDDDNTSFNTTTYPSAVNTTAKPYKITDWKALYTALEAYRGKPVMISYEAADAQQGQEMYYTGTGGATRNDGRWLYSKNGENITSNIKIQYSDDNGATYTDLNTTTPQVTGLSAYFTNDGVEGEMTYSTTIDPDKTFDFEAKTTNGNYKFVGWFMEDGTKITTDNASHTERSGSYTFVAKFMQVQSGQLILSHSTDTDETYKGSGTAKIGVVVKNGDGETVRTYDLTTSDITLDDKVIKSDSANTIEVTLEATATGYDEYGTTVLATPSDGAATYYKNPSITGEKTKTIVLDSFTVASLFSGTTQNVKNIIYHSYFSEAVFNYNLTFAFNDRFGNAKKYIKEGKLTSNQAANTKYVKVIDEKTYLLPEFYSTLAPHESNFGKDFEWLMTDNLEFNHDGSVYTCTATISSNQTTGKRTATFNLPYAHTNGVPSSYGVMDKASVTNLVIENIDYGSLVKNKKDNDNFVTAPRQLNDSGTIKNFQYWSIASTSNPDKEVSRCYYYKFNFVMYDNYIITPVYENSESVLGSENPLPSISFLQSTRNQYNADSDDTLAVNGKALDYVFNDFVMSFDYNNIEIFKADETSNSITQLGYVVERVQKLEIKQDGTPYTDPTHYSDKNLKTVEQIKTWIDNNKSNTNVVKDGKTLTRFTVNKSDLDNKNRVEFYEAYLNSKEWNSTDQTFARKSADKNYVYKAYTYMIVNGEVYLSDPAYFTMYEEATQK